MLTALSIRNVVLIERLDLTFGPGLTVLTGETGAGKSILLDALGLALGARADAGLVRTGAEMASVTAVFDIADGHGARAILSENGLDGEGDLILRRTVGADRRSRAFVNDQPVGAGLLAEIGEALVEVHGQHDDRGLMHAAGHRALLDAFGGLEAQAAGVGECWTALSAARNDLETARGEVAQAAADADFLRFAADELARLDPQEGEEGSLAASRALMMNAEKLAGALEEAAALVNGAGGQGAGAQGGGVEERLSGAIRVLAPASAKADGLLDDLIAVLDRALVEAGEAVAALDSAGQRLEYDQGALERTEERLFALRAASRKHNVPVDDLPALRARFEARLADIDHGEDRLKALAKAVTAAERAYNAAAADLGAARRAAAARLDAAVAGELAPLRMGAARFSTTLSDAAPGPDGADRVAFEVATNPGAAPGALSKIASGGELSRFLLALKVALAGTKSAPTMIFDEVDRGVGGATADAVGARLARLAEGAQVLVVTHSPQVAAKGAAHLRIAKAEAKGVTLTSVEAIDGSARREEIARMLSGAAVTEAARAAADDLMNAG